MQFLRPPDNDGFYGIYTRRMSVDLLPDDFRPKLYIRTSRNTYSFGVWYVRKWKRGKLVPVK